MSNQNTEEVQTEQEQSGKTEKKFTQALDRLVAVVGGKENLKIPNKVPKDQLGSVISELFSEERDVVLKDTKEKLRNLLKQFAEMTKALEAKKQELTKLEKQKKEEFVKAAEELFNKIQDVGEVEKLYYKGLKEATA
jgi:fructose-1-phosphate kinase PfkB-like protein